MLLPAVALALLLLLGRGGPVARPVTVEVDVFSGRTNPSWSLDGGEAAELAARLSGLPASPRPFAEVGLGYRGFVVHGRAAGEVRVHRGVVRVGGRDYEDARGLEGWLAERARARGYGMLVP